MSLGGISFRGEQFDRPEVGGCSMHKSGQRTSAKIMSKVNERVIKARVNSDPILRMAIL